MGDWSDDDTPAKATPTSTDRPAKSDDGCRKCGESGHMARDCSVADKCRKCNQEGHIAKDCEIPDKCRKCNEEGHIARDCHLPDTCRRCNQEGHKVAECTEPEVTRTVVTADGEEKEIYVRQEVRDDDLYQDTISSGINFEQYYDIPIEVKGEGVPPKITDFKESGLRALILDNITKSKYKKPTPVQQNAIPIIMAKRDMMACAQTGSGKTAAFLLPIIHNIIKEGSPSNAGCPTQRPQAVVMTPTRELAIQISDQSRKFSLGSSCKNVVVYGGTSVGHQRANLQRGCNVLVATPGRLLDFVEKDVVSFSHLEYFILDEADRMIDMGFMPEVERCMANPDMPDKTKRNTLMFSATFPPEVQKNAKQFLRQDNIFLSVGLVGATCKDVKQTFLNVGKTEKKKKLDAILNDESRDPLERVLVFVNTKKNADFLATHLSQHSLPATSIQGDRKQREREEALADFKKGTRPILIATAVAARGLDIPAVAKVINYDMPKDVDEYVHRIGRTGRVGNLGEATSFFDAENDGEVVGALVALLVKSGVEVPDFMGDGGSGAVESGDAEDDW